MKRGLQVALGIFSLIPLVFALLGFAFGAERLSPGGVTIPLDNQYRYFSGVYLVVSFVLWAIIPTIERQGKLLGLVSLAIFIGGLGRAWSWTTLGAPEQDQLVALGIELVAPIVFVLWQRAVAKSA